MVIGVLGFCAYQIHSVYQTWKESQMIRQYYEQFEAKMQAHLLELLKEKERKIQYPKWIALTKEQQTTLLSLMRMCNKGDTEGEQQGGRNALDRKMKKFGLTEGDLPQIEKAEKMLV